MAPQSCPHANSEKPWMYTLTDKAEFVMSIRLQSFKVNSPDKIAYILCKILIIIYY